MNSFNSKKSHNFTLTKEEIQQIEKLFSASGKKIIISHANPDGDAVGSVLAMYGYLKQQANDLVPILPDETPEFYKWLTFSDHILHADNDKEACKQQIRKADVILCVDFNSFKRVNDLADVLTESQATKILIDHHPHSASTFHYVLSDVNVSSTAELIYRFFQQLDYNAKINKQIAEAIYTGIMTDTGSFHFNSGNSKMYDVLGDIVKKGIDPGYIHHKVYDNFSESRMRLIGYCLVNKLVVLREYKTAYISLTKKELEKFNHQKGDTEGLVNYPLEIEGIVFAALFTEQDDLVKVSFRSKGSFQANQFAENHFRGGGHKNAAGGKSYISLPDTIQAFESFVKQYKNQLTDEDY